MVSLSPAPPSSSLPPHTLKSIPFLALSLKCKWAFKSNNSKQSEQIRSKEKAQEAYICTSKPHKNTKPEANICVCIIYVYNTYICI